MGDKILETLLKQNASLEEKITIERPRFKFPEKRTIDEVMEKEKPKEDEAFVIVQDGGVGDAICATPMISSAKKVYWDKKIIVASTHHEVLIGNPDIDTLYNLAFPGNIYEKWVRPLRHFGSVIKRDIYNELAHKLFPGPLSMVWCYLYDVPWENDDIKVHLHANEIDEADNFLSSFSRPVIIIHTSGGRLTFDPKVQMTEVKDWFLDRWQKLVSILNKKYDVVQVGGAHEQEIPGASCYLLGKTSLRQSAALLKRCLTYICIDSFVGHCGAAVGIPGVVMFGRSNPHVAGHEINTNLFVEGSCEFNDLFCCRPTGSLGDSKMYSGQMKPWRCPSRSCMQAISVDFVAESVFEIISRRKPILEVKT